MCWPTLVFRGTDMEDFHGLGFSVRIRVDNLADLIKDVTTRGLTELQEAAAAAEAASYGVPIFPISSERREEVIQDGMERAKEAERAEARKKAIEETEEGTPERAEALARAEHADATFIDQTIILDAEFLKKHKTYTRADALRAGFKPMEGISFPAIKGDIGGLLGGFAEVKVEILTRPQERTGDWIANLLQGIGDIENSLQYKRAIERTKYIIRNYIKDSKDKRLTITGHSLGGGLATAADFTARYNYYKTNIQFYTIVFNPAGLHENTIQYIKDNSEYAKDVQAEHEEALRRVEQDFEERGEQMLQRNKEQAQNCERKPGLNDSAFNVFRVKDEILTTLEYTPQHIPFLEGLMGILGQKFPKPEGADNVLIPVSPGHNQAQESQLRMQVMARGLYHLKGYMPPHRKFASMPILFPLSEQNAVNNQKFPHILALSAIFAKYGKDIKNDPPTALSACLNEMIDYLDKAFFGGNLTRYIQSRGEDRHALSLLWGGIKTWWDLISGEVEDLKKVMAICNEYHGMDYVIAAYKHKLQEEARQRDEEARKQYENYKNYQPSNIGWESLGNLRF